MSISMKSEALDRAADFSYQGHTVAYNNSNWTSLYQNLSKGWWWREVLAKVVTKTGAMVQRGGCFTRQSFIWCFCMGARYG